MARATSLLKSIRQLRAELVAEPSRYARVVELQSWQTARLRRTYADYYTQVRYRDTLDFFVNDLYGPHDYAKRDRELGNVLGRFERALPGRVINALVAALELEELSQELDAAMADALDTVKVTEAAYARAYRQIGRRDERRKQIDLIVAAGRGLDGVAGKPAIGAALRAARLPARLLDLAALHDFLERGYAAFVKMNGGESLLTSIQDRETIIMRKLFTGARDPFNWEQP